MTHETYNASEATASLQTNLLTSDHKTIISTLRKPVSCALHQLVTHVLAAKLDWCWVVVGVIKIDGDDVCT